MTIKYNYLIKVAIFRADDNDELVIYVTALLITFLKPM